MVGDRIYTDIAMARRAGACWRCWSLSGEATAADAAAHRACRPDLIVADVGELGERLEVRPERWGLDDERQRDLSKNDQSAGE